MVEGENARQAHWEKAYRRTEAEARSWYQTEPSVSLGLVEAAGFGAGARLLDVGGGTSRLIDGLLESGYKALGVLDISPAAVEQAQARLGKRAASVEWFVGDVTDFVPPHDWDVWHDRAVFHFLTERSDREAYRASLDRSLVPGGRAIIATFSPTGPERCSGLPTVCYSAETLSQELGPEFELLQSVAETHVTPGAREQDFLYCLFRKLK